MLLVPAGQPHRTIELERTEYWGLAFSVPTFASGGDASLLDPFERVRGGAAPVVSIPHARQAHLEELFRELSGVDRPPWPALDAVRRSLLTLILAEVGRAARSDDAPDTGGGGVVADALRFIERNCLGKLTVEDVARAVGRSATHVTAALTRATGRSAGKWILHGRMGEARRLLLHSDEPVDSIAERVGYADATHFIRMFRREQGATPAAWRAARRRQSAEEARSSALRRDASAVCSVPPRKR